jgi:hypothetical protein
VSTPNKTDPARGWMYVEKLLAEEEAERIERLSDEEFAAELKRKGVDPSRARSAEDLLARAMARAAQQRPVVAPTPSRPLEPAVKPEPAATAKSPAAPEGRVVPLPQRRPRMAWWAAAAASIAAIVGAAALEGPAVVAHFRPPTPEEKAEGLRDEAIADCARGSWGPCAQRLDEAARLDPAGESAERVQKAREAIAKATHPGPGR